MITNKTKEKKTVKIPFRLWYALTTGFLVIPVIIFCAGYLRWYFGIPLAVLFAAFSVYAVIDCTKYAAGRTQLLENASDFVIPLKYLMGFAVFALFLSYFSGVGEFIYSLQDHAFRRATLSDLISYRWPVIFDYSTQTNPTVIEILGKTSGKAAFIYYYTYWMPAALFGKMFGRTSADIFLMLWNAVGIFLALLGMAKINGRACVTQPIFYMFFGGLDAIPTVIHSVVEYPYWTSIEGYVPNMAYYCNMSELANVFHQCVPCFLIAVLVMLSVNTRTFGLTGGLLFAYSPFGVFGILPVILTAVFRKEMRQDVKSTLKDLFTPANIICAAALLFVYGSFYTANAGVVGQTGFTWKYFSSFGLFIICYLCFLLIDVIPVTAILFKRYRKNPFYICAAVSLIMIPLYMMSWVNDFAMRASMPARFIMCVFLAGLFKDLYDEDAKLIAARKKRSRKETAGLVLAILATILMMFPGFVNAYLIAGSQAIGYLDRKEMVGSFGNINNAYDDTIEYALVAKKQFHTDNYMDTFFYRYMAKQ